MTASLRTTAQATWTCAEAQVREKSLPRFLTRVSCLLAPEVSQAERYGVGEKLERERRRGRRRRRKDTKIELKESELGVCKM